MAEQDKSQLLPNNIVEDLDRITKPLTEIVENSEENLINIFTTPLIESLDKADEDFERGHITLEKHAELYSEVARDTTLTAVLIAFESPKLNKSRLYRKSFAEVDPLKVAENLVFKMSDRLGGDPEELKQKFMDFIEALQKI